jgi:hypothetical protein
MKRAASRVFPLLALVLLACGAGACNSYSYYDLTLKLNTNFNITKTGSIEHCRLDISGAASDSVELDDTVCRTAFTGDLGTVEYSTFADSGSITFTLRLFQDPESNALCLLGEGATTLEAAKAVRRTGTITATAPAPENPAGKCK